MRESYTSIYGYQVSRYMEYVTILNGKALWNMVKREKLHEVKSAVRRGYIPHPDGWDVYHVYSYKKGDFDGYAVLSPLICTSGKANITKTTF